MDVRQGSRRHGAEEGKPRPLPPRAGLLSLVSVNETAQAHDGGQRQHDGVEAQPGKVDADLLPIVLPAGHRDKTPKLALRLMLPWKQRSARRSPDQVERLHLVEAFGVSPFLVEQEPLAGAAVVLGPDVELALKEATRNLQPVLLGTPAPQLVTCSYVVEGVGGLVHAAVQQLADAELLHVASYLVGGAAQEVIRLKGRRNEQNGHTEPAVETGRASEPFCSSWTA